MYVIPSGTLVTTYVSWRQPTTSASLGQSLQILRIVSCDVIRGKNDCNSRFLHVEKVVKVLQISKKSHHVLDGHGSVPPLLSLNQAAYVL